MAAVGGLVEAGLVAGTAGHDDGGVGVPGPDAAEVELFGSGWHGAALPHVAAVLGAQDGAVGSAGPGYSAAHGVDATQAGGGSARLHLPWAGFLDLTECDCREQADGGQCCHDFHRKQNT